MTTTQEGIKMTFTDCPSDDFHTFHIIGGAAATASIISVSRNGIFKVKGKTEFSNSELAQALREAATAVDQQWRPT